MGQVNGLAEAAAIHIRIGNEEGQGKQREEAEESGGDDRDRLPPDTGEQRGAGARFQQGEHDADPFREAPEEAEMHPLQVFGDDEPRSHGIVEFQESPGEEDQADEDGGNSAEPDAFHRAFPR